MSPEEEKLINGLFAHWGVILQIQGIKRLNEKYVKIMENFTKLITDIERCGGRVDRVCDDPILDYLIVTDSQGDKHSYLNDMNQLERYKLLKFYGI